MNLGIIGTGIIVDRMISAVQALPSACVMAIYSRDIRKANRMCEHYGVAYAYDCLDSMLKNPNIDAVYIASPNSLHYDHAMRCLVHGKHVFVEKPLFGNVAKTKHVFAFALHHDCYIFETIYNLYLPNYQVLVDALNDIGTLALVECNFSKKSSRYDAFMEGELVNVFNPLYSGGALADLNIYHLHIMMKLLGVPCDAHYQAIQHENGIDLSGVVTLKYESCLAVCIASKQSGTANYALFQGDKGHIRVRGGLNRIEAIELCTSTKTQVINHQDKPHMYYQFERFIRAIDEKDCEFLKETMDHSLRVVSLASDLRKEIGLDFEF